MTVENTQDMALAIIEHVRLLQSQIDGIKDWILDQPNAPTLEKLDLQLYDLECDIRNDQKFRDQSDEWKNAIQAKDDAKDILQLLHNLVTEGQMNA